MQVPLWITILSPLVSLAGIIATGTIATLSLKATREQAKATTTQFEADHLEQVRSKQREAVAEVFPEILATTGAFAYFCGSVIHTRDETRPDESLAGTRPEGVRAVIEKVQGLYSSVVKANLLIPDDDLTLILGNIAVVCRDIVDFASEVHDGADPLDEQKYLQLTKQMGALESELRDTSFKRLQPRQVLKFADRPLE